MQLHHLIDEPLKKSIEEKAPKTVQDVWEVFKSTILENSILEHEDIRYYGVESDYSTVGNIGSYRVTFLYRVAFIVEGEEDELTQSNDIEFEKTENYESVDLEKAYLGGIFNDEYTLVEMFDMIENMETFRCLKNESLNFKIFAQNVC